MRLLHNKTLAIGLAALPSARGQPEGHRCSDFTRSSFSNHSIVTLAETLSAGSNFTGNSTETSYNSLQTDLPQLCRIAFTTHTSSNSTANAEIWLPDAVSWNGRFLAVGNGGFAGGINYPDVVWGVRKGFATMSTNTGHESTQSDGTWMLNAPEKLTDFGHRALHLTTQTAKRLVRAYYEQDFHHSYYAGCSTGGRQGLNAAQRYPDDYDGVLVGSAIPSQTHTSAWQIYVALLQYPNTSAEYIPATMWTTIHQAVLDQCDLNDGMDDGIVMNPGECHFDSSVVLCERSISNPSSCLSEAQRANLDRMYAPWLSNNGTMINPGISLSGEASFSYLMNSAEPQFGPSFYRYAVFNDSAWDWRDMSPDVVTLAASINPGGMDVNPNLHEFRKAGGKLMQYHGYSDPLIPSMNMPVWYDQVKDTRKKGGVAVDLADFYRIFMVPGMGHCSGGDGAWVLDAASQGGVTPKDNDSEHSMLWSLVDWVERDREPSMIVGTKFVNDTAADGIDFTRPICQWPMVAEYVGGLADEVKSWKCSS